MSLSAALPRTKLLIDGDWGDAQTGNQFTTFNPAMEEPIAQEEVFGPIVSILRFGDEAEALSLANGTAYSLAGAVWTSNVDRAHRAASRMNAGTVWVNTYGPTDARLPWGGMGGESDLGRSALEAYRR